MKMHVSSIHDKEKCSAKKDTNCYGTSKGKGRGNFDTKENVGKTEINDKVRGKKGSILLRLPRCHNGKDPSHIPQDIRVYTTTLAQERKA